MKKLKLSVAALLIATASFGQTTETNQCTAMTKKQVQCKNNTKNITLLCGVHDPNHVSKSDKVTVVCSGTTKAGNKCKSKTKNTSGLCHNHKED